MIRAPKKLIEVALPLDAINEAAAREKSIRHGHPSTLHLWWARRPLAAARAVLFAQLVNDPGYERHLQRGVNKEQAALERDRLFKIIEKMVLWENTNNEEVLEEARKEIWKSWRETCRLNKDHPQAAELFNPDKLPAFHDPFAGGGALPLEAQRLGLEAYASDLNPVAVLINKAMIEIPPRFAGKPPINPESYKRKDLIEREWKGAQGLAEDIRYYGQWMRDEAVKRIGHLYPKVEVTPEMVKERKDLKPYVGKQLTVVAWIWARTVKSPNPAFSNVDVPLASTFILSTKVGREAYVEPVIKDNGYYFTVKEGKPKDVEAAKHGTKAPGKGSGFYCLLSKSPIDGKHLKAEAQAGRLGVRLMAIVADGMPGRVYLAPTAEQETIARQAKPGWKPEQELVGKTRDQMPLYGMNTFGDLFTQRQLAALTTFSDLIDEARERIRFDAIAAGLPDDSIPLRDGGLCATARAEAVGVYLACAVDYAANYWSVIATPAEGFIRGTFSRQALPMTWDYAEAPPFGSTSGNWLSGIEWITKALDLFPLCGHGYATQTDAANQSISLGKFVSTDPPYYDNICYADLSDFFYVWLRRSLRPVFPSLFATLAVPKAEELIASHYRHGSKEDAEGFFLNGMTQAMHRLAEQVHPVFPVTIYYAFKQSESESDSGTASTGWETFLEAVIRAGFSISGTWPMRTERGARSVGIGTNALASSIILVCRKRPPDSSSISRREFIRELNEALPLALDEITRGGVNSPVAPVDLSQAIIGPGMAIFSKYAAVLEADGKPMTVRTALQLINRFLAEDDFDHDTQFCLHWFENYGWSEGKFGEADVLARAKGTSVDGVKGSGVLASAKGVVQLLRWRDYPQDWSPESDHRTPIWEALHQMIRSLQQESEAVAGALLARMPTRAEPMRQLAYRLYTLCERKGWAEDARAYNEMITSWSAIERASQEVAHVGKQTEMDV